MKEGDVEKRIEMFYIGIIIILFAGYSQASEYDPNQQKIFHILSSIPEDDKQEIKNLFSYLFKYQRFAYSLYGDKPLTFCDTSLTPYSIQELHDLLSIEEYCYDLLKSFCEPSHSLKRKWEIWKKYSHLFYVNNYCLIDKQLDDKFYIIIINKKHFINTVNKNLDLFQHIISPSLSAPNLLTQLVFGKTSLFETLHHHEGLLGILLGFGRYNSLLFQQRENLLKALAQVHLLNIQKVHFIQEKLHLIDNKLQSLREHDPFIISSINRVCFAANPYHPETQIIKLKYDSLNKLINTIYSKEDWFEQTLLRLMTGE